MRIEWYYLKNVFSALIMRLFLTKKSEHFERWKKLENMMMEECFFFKEKTFSSSKIAPLPNWEGAKYAGGSRPSCSFLVSNQAAPNQRGFRMLLEYEKLKICGKLVMITSSVN